MARVPTPAWVPGEDERTRSNLAALLRDRGVRDYASLHAWSAADRAGFWGEMVRRLGIRFRRAPDAVLDLSSGVESPRWLPGARLNIAESCFSAAPDSVAVVRRREAGPLERFTVADLDRISNRVAAGLPALGLGPGDPVAVDLPMGYEAVAIYLGLVKAGCPVVSIADSFAPEEIAARLRIGGAKAIFTEDYIRRDGRRLPLYGKVVDAGAPVAVVLSASPRPEVTLRAGDTAFASFLPENAAFEAVARDPDDVTNVLFSSGTTGDPKAIPWTQTTPIKCASDGHLHHDIRPGHVVAWPTNLGWMMGPWLIYAALVNRATIAIYEGSPAGRGFGEFVRDARVNMLGLVPSLVRAWREGGGIEGLDWSAIHVFSSTGECSNADDMRWLMGLAGGRPVIEYCGGTEIGGGYVTGTVLQSAIPATFTTPALGLDFRILDGEVFLVPPSIGLSTRLLNRDHHEVYYEGAPAGPAGEVLRRHGDEIGRLPGGYYRAHGRVDDTMNLGGIKVSSASIERVLAGTPGVTETAAVAAEPEGGGPSLLVVFAVPAPGAPPDAAALRASFQSAIRARLNPLFKVRRRVLRAV